MGAKLFRRVTGTGMPGTAFAYVRGREEKDEA